MAYIINDRPHINPAANIPLYIRAKKRSKNGNQKKIIAWKTTGGSHTAEIVDRMQKETAWSRVEIEIAAEVDGGEIVVESENEFIKRVKMMKK